MKTKRSVKASEISATQEKNRASRDRLMRRRLIAALDGTWTLKCTDGTLRALRDWHGDPDVGVHAEMFNTNRFAVAAVLVMSKVTGFSAEKLSFATIRQSLKSPPRTVLVIERGARWAYDVVAIGPHAIELRYASATPEKGTRMFRRSDGVAIDDPKARIAAEDLAALTGRTTAEIAKAAGEAVPGWLRAGQRVRYKRTGRTGLIFETGATLGHLRDLVEVQWDEGTSLYFERHDAVQGLEPIGEERASSAPSDRPHIHGQIDVWTSEALQGLAPRVSARIWQAYRAGQGGNACAAAFSEAGHELAAQEAERLRGELKRERQEAKVALQGAAERDDMFLLERDEARRAEHNAREELHLAETSLVTTAKERDDAADELREARAQRDAAIEAARVIQDSAVFEQIGVLKAERDEAQRARVDLAARCGVLQLERDAARDQRDALEAQIADVHARIGDITRRLKGAA